MKKKITLKNLQRLASSKKGTCLSKRYINSNTKYLWRCEKNHRFEASYTNVKGNPSKKGTWCPYCSGTKVDPEKEISLLKGIVRRNGGKLLTDQYKGSKVPIKAVCKEGHKFKTTASYLKLGRWCLECSKVSRGLKKRKEVSLSDMKKLAASRGLEFLSSKYERTADKYLWRCKSCKYEWETTHNTIASRKRGCPKCGQKRSNEAKMKSLTQAKLEAKQAGFFLISDRYLGHNKKHRYSCKSCGAETTKIHGMVVDKRVKCGNCFKTTSMGEHLVKIALESIFEKPFSKIKPEWLQQGETRTTRLEIDLYNDELRLGFEVQGRQHYEYIPWFHKSRSKFKDLVRRDREKRKKCKQHGVILIEVPGVPELLLLEDLQKYLIEECKENSVKVPKGASTKNINYNKKFKNYSKTLMGRYQKILEPYGLEILDQHFINSKSKIKIKCVCGKTFKRDPISIVQGRVKSCPICSKERIGSYQKKGLKERQVEAKVKGFILLDDEVGGTYDDLLYICEKGFHLKFSSPSNFRKIKECSKCTRLAKRLKLVERIASRKGFELLDFEEKDINASRTFKCKKCGDLRKTRPKALTKCKKH